MRIVLAEAAAAPGPLHYLLEGEGFQVLGCASDDGELTRLLSQSTQPDVIVVDAEVPATTVMVASEFAPGSELIVIWPEDVVPPASADQVLPELVFEDLGPAVRRAAERNRLRRPVVEESDEIVEAWNEPERADPSNAAARQTAARVLVGTVAVIASILVTMGASFALEGWRAAHVPTPARSPSLASPTAALTGRSSPAGSVREAPGASPTTERGCAAGRRSGPNEHAATQAQDRADCPSQAGGGNGAGRGANRGAGTTKGSGDKGAAGHGHGQGAGQGGGQSTDHGSGQGSGRGSGQGSGRGSGAGASHGPDVDPPAPSLPPAAGDHHPGPKD